LFAYMSSMTQKAESDCSYPESDLVDWKSQILKVYERLTSVVKEEVDLRRDLEDLFDKQEAEAIEEMKKAERNVGLIRSERDRMRRQLEQDGLRLESIPVPTLPAQNVSSRRFSFRNLPPHEDTPHFDQILLHTPGTVYTDIIEDLPTPAVPKPKPKYGGDEVALRLATEMHNLEAHVQDLREKVEKADETATKWDKIRSECSQNNQQKTYQFAQQQYAAAQSEARDYRQRMTYPEEQIAIRRDILAQFKDEDDLSETEVQPELLNGPQTLSLKGKGKKKKGGKLGQVAGL